MSLLKHAPAWDAPAARQLVKSLYGFSADVSPLPSERDQNFLVIAAGVKFVLKIANALENADLLTAQTDVLKHLAHRVTYCPRICSTRTGEDLSTAESPNGNSHFVRLINFLPGVPLGESSQHPPALLFDLGTKMGKLDQSLADFSHPALHRDFHWDLANGLRVVQEYSGLIPKGELRDLVVWIAAEYKAKISLLEPQLRRSVIHGDANDYNVLVDEEVIISGIIDFGDMVYSYTVGDLAIATAYVVLHCDDVVSTVSTVVDGYMREYPLTDVEQTALWPLVLMRLCMSVSLAAYQRQQQPENEYLSISQKAINDRLPGLAAIDWSTVSDALNERSRQVQSL